MKIAPVQNNYNPNFQGNPLKIIGNAKKAYCSALSKPIAKGMGVLAGTKASKKLVETFAKFQNPSTMWSHMASFAITYFYVRNTAKSDKIDEERKLPLMINNVLVTVASSTAACLVDKLTDKPLQNILKGYVKEHGADMIKKSNDGIIETVKDSLKNGTALDMQKLTKHGSEIINNNPLENMSEVFKSGYRALFENDTIQNAIQQGIIKTEDVLSMCASGFEKQIGKINKLNYKTKSLTVFTFTVRFLVTVLMVPIIGKVVALVNKKLGRDKSEKPENNMNIPPAGSETLGMKDFINTVK